MPMDPALAAKEVLCKIMEGETIWELSEAKEYRRNLEVLALRIKGSKGGNKLFRRKSRKTAKNLRHKIKYLDQNNARVFETKLNLETEHHGAWLKRKDVLVRVEIQDGGVVMSFFEERYDWSNYSVDRKLQWHEIVSISSEELSELAMLPAFLRDKEVVKFHEESRYVEKDD